MSNTAFAYLQEIDQSCRQKQLKFPTHTQTEQPWLGIGFLLYGNQYVIPLTQILEVIREIKISNIPGLKTWLNGVVNIKGKLVPVTDLQEYLFGIGLITTNDSKLLLMSDSVYEYAFLVEKVFGLKKFSLTHEIIVSPETHPKTAPFVVSEFIDHQGGWKIFNLKRILDNNDFYMIG